MIAIASGSEFNLRFLDHESCMAMSCSRLAFQKARVALDAISQ